MKCSKYLEKYGKTDIGLKLNICFLSLDLCKGITMAIFVSTGPVIIEQLITDAKT